MKNMEHTPLFDHEKLDVYCLELEFVGWVTDFFDDIASSAVRYRGELLEQLDRASLSALLNTAEGNGKRRGPQRAKFFDDARGSVIECAACLDASVAKRFVSSAFRKGDASADRRNADSTSRFV